MARTRWLRAPQQRATPGCVGLVLLKIRSFVGGKLAESMKAAA
jgi:hypothetical protein